MDYKTQRHAGRTRWTRLGLAALAAGVVGLTLLNTLPSTSSAAEHATFAAAPGGVSFADVIEQVSPAVVNITVEKVAGPMPTAGAPTPFDDFFERFFGVPGGQGFGQSPRYAPQQPHAEAQGSGFIIDADGYIATNNHVVENADSVTVTLDSGEELHAVVVGTDPQTDVALIKVDSDDLPHVAFGDSDHARVGDWVVAIGNPFGLGGTATAGIISARGRDIRSGPYDDYLQIDAPINAGNSGGPVFNAAGEVIGINTAIFSPNGGNIGIGFAIPSNLAKQVLDELREQGSVSRGWLGVQIQPVDHDLAAAFGLDPDAAGVLVAEVVAGSPADRAGIEAGDVVTEFAGQAVDSPKGLARIVGAHDSGERVDVTVWRDGRERRIPVELGELESDGTVAAVAPSGHGSATSDFGLTLEDLTPRVADELGMPEDVRGAVVVDVAPGSPASEQGIRRGDVIVAVDRNSTDSARDVADALAANKSDRALLLVRRGDSQRFVALKRDA